MSDLLSPAAVELALAIWREQIAYGIGAPDEYDPDLLWMWLDNRSYSPEVLERAAAGDVAALVEVRLDAGLPVFV